MKLNPFAFLILLYSSASILGMPPHHHGDKDHGIDNRSSENLVDFSEIMATCNESFRITFEYMQEFNTSGSIPDETDKTPMCFMRCVLERAGVLRDGIIKKSKVIDLLWPATGDSVEACQAESDGEENPCQKAYIIARCMMTRALVDGRNKTTN